MKKYTKTDNTKCKYVGKVKIGIRHCHTIRLRGFPLFTHISHYNYKKFIKGDAIKIIEGDWLNMLYDKSLYPVTEPVHESSKV